MPLRLDSNTGGEMRAWIRPSLAFMIFLYFIFFLGVYVHTSESESTFNGNNHLIEPDAIDSFLRKIGQSFKN